MMTDSTRIQSFLRDYSFSHMWNYNFGIDLTAEIQYESLEIETKQNA